MMAHTSTVEVLTGAPVTMVGRHPSGGFTIRNANGQERHVDDLVFASSGPATRELLTGLSGTASQQAALQGIEFRDARLALHIDPVYAPAVREYWSFFNAQVRANYCEASMWLTEVIAGPSAAKAPRIWKSWVTHRSQPPAAILAQAQFRHMLPTPGTLRAQNELLKLQGQGGVWFAGGYTRPYDSQETALVSSIDVAQRLLSLPG
jgi:predicted NAD/FAD-binding protein